MTSITCVLLATVLLSADAAGQNIESDLEKLMVKYEEQVLHAYEEKQSLQASPAALPEKAAFDSVLSSYTVRVLEIYETLNRMKGFTLENYRNIAARALIFRALAFLETAPGDSAKLQRACQDYRKALTLTKGNKVPVISQQLPYEVWIGNRLFPRLADLLDDRDRGLLLLRCMQQMEAYPQEKQ